MGSAHGVVGVGAGQAAVGAGLLPTRLPRRRPGAQPLRQPPHLPQRQPGQCTGQQRQRQALADAAQVTGFAHLGNGCLQPAAHHLGSAGQWLAGHVQRHVVGQQVEHDAAVHLHAGVAVLQPQRDRARAVQRQHLTQQHLGLGGALGRRPAQLRTAEIDDAPLVQLQGHAGMHLRRAGGGCGQGGGVGGRQARRRGLGRGRRGRHLRPCRRRQQRQPQQQRGGQPRCPGQRAGAGAVKAGRRQAAGSGAPDSTRRLHVSGGAGPYSMGVGVGTPSSRRPVSSKVASPTIMCWVATCTLRSARCSGELANTAPPPARV